MSHPLILDQWFNSNSLPLRNNYGGSGQLRQNRDKTPWYCPVPLLAYPFFPSPPLFRILSHIQFTGDGLNFGEKKKKRFSWGSRGLVMKKFSFCDDIPVASACFVPRNRFLSFLIMAPLGLGRVACGVADHIGHWSAGVKDDGRGRAVSPSLALD